MELEYIDIFLDHLINKLNLKEEILGLVVGFDYFHPKP